MKERTAELKEKIEKDYKDMMAVINSTSLPLFVEDTIEDMHILIETLRAENKELKEENEEWKAIFDMGNSRTYRKKYIEERRKEQPNLLYPDFDEVYQKYFELRKERDNLKMDLTDVYLDGIYDERTKWKEKIKKELAELQSMKVDGEVFKTAVNYAINILQSLLGKE